MKSICITGSVQPGLQAIADILQQAGMKQPKPSKDDHSIDIICWHEQVANVTTKASHDIQAISQPGQPWERHARDLFLANNKSSVWGWADSRSIQLLDFWCHFESRLRFILVCLSPQQMLANFMVNETNAISVEKVMHAWQVQHQALLHFYQRNPRRSLLVDSSQCLHYPKQLVEYCAKQWKLPLTIPAYTGNSVPEQDSLTRYLAQQLCQDYPQIIRLQHEIASAMRPLGETAPVVDTDISTSEQIMADYHLLRGRSTESQPAQAAYEKPAMLPTQHDDAIACNAQQHTDDQARLNTALYEQELLLTRFHQIREELDTISLQYQSGQEQIHALAQLNATLESDKATLTQEITALIQSREEQASILTACQARIDQLNQFQTENNDQLLLEIHQAHLESEHYFQQHQAARDQLQMAETRWQRLLQRYPACLDYETIEILPVSANQDDPVTWRLTHFNIPGYHPPVFEFKTPLTQGIAGFTFTHSPEAGSPFIDALGTHLQNGLTELTLIPAGTKTALQQCFDILLNVNTRDWALLQALSKLLIKTLTAPAILREHAVIQPKALRAGLEKFDQLLQKLPPVVRYDQIRFKQERIHADYEHLWLHFDQLSFGDQRWARFEFRLACAAIHSKPFGTHPRLEFPEEAGQAPFEAWFIESYDDVGTKLELRFAQPDAMDMAIWWRLTKQDQRFLLALIDRLPAILQTLRSTDIQLNRPWEDWLNLAHEIQRIVKLRAGTPTAAPTPLMPAASENPEAFPASSLQAIKQSSDKPASKAKAVKSMRTSNTRRARK
ncbi:hypothetical protein SAMN05216419_101217 [Nitrosomonas cryotolerans]|uniref:Uncharacterized protein n=1 Tax=Nitrosomonas cryotolerans ATCC 49181 TaxID=1131553 RepID=A0A1N6JFR2_9PROT|nr:hypothetical protein [Nitrosomonas cryotolerans]SFP66861.1 hypothetical protein SAMN05216419_101217 [Nitrosomonas cryotolerans]SIO42989.1 hypothetical protein SAMN02743940_2567 [Nitrosomonas cryotolerans ATCC 49181]